MEVEEIQGQACKFPRIGNGTRGESNKLLGHKGGSDHHYPDDDEDTRELKRVGGGVTDTSVVNGGANRLRGWHHSSRIIRVSRASGGKDRHSKVWTSKGLRDRRVRLSVTTAIQFYDLQDRLGYDQPSKAVEWLINAASDAIAELPSLNSSFPDTPKQLSDEKRGSTAGTEQGFDSAEVELDGDQGSYHQNQHHHHQQQQQNQHLSLSKSACSSTSETSKGSGLSLSRSEIRVNRVKARERARERAAKEKEKENESRIVHNHNHNENMNPMPQNSFTNLLVTGMSNANNNSNNSSSSPNASAGGTHMDYFASGLLGLSSTPRTHHQSSGFSGQIHLGNTMAMSMSMSSLPPQFSLVSGDQNNHAETVLQPGFSFVNPENLIPVAASQPNGSGGDYNLNLSFSSGLAGFNRGTLQSNSPSLLPHLQRFSPIDGTNVPFFLGAAAAASAAAPPMENHHNHNHHHHHHHQFPASFDARLQLRYGDGSRHSDQKGKGKN